MSEPTYQGWAILELMGHRKLAGYVSESSIGGASLIRIDVPQRDGTSVTQFYAPAALYALTPTTEDVIKRFNGNAVAPVSPWEMRQPELPAPGNATDPDAEDDGSSGTEWDPDDDMRRS